MRSVGKRGARSSGPTGWRVAGCSGGGGGEGRSGTRLYHRVGNSDSGRVYLVCSLVIGPPGGLRLAAWSTPAQATPTGPGRAGDLAPGDRWGLSRPDLSGPAGTTPPPGTGLGRPLPPVTGRRWKAASHRGGRGRTSPEPPCARAGAAQGRAGAAKPVSSVGPARPHRLAA